MIRQRIRIRFRKQGDLRWISHRDLARAFERLFRRAELPLSMSEGFHPKPRMSFPLALGLGIAAEDECMELELAQTADPASLKQQLNQLAPPGLEILKVESLQPGHGKAQAARMTYEIDVPLARRDAVQHAIDTLLSRRTMPIRREGRAAPLELLAGLSGLQLERGVLQFTLEASRQASVRPREVLQALQVNDLEAHGAVLRRTVVQLQEELVAVAQETDSANEKGRS